MEPITVNKIDLFIKLRTGKGNVSLSIEKLNVRFSTWKTFQNLAVSSLFMSKIKKIKEESSFGSKKISRITLDRTGEGGADTEIETFTRAQLKFHHFRTVVDKKTVLKSVTPWGFPPCEGRCKFFNFFRREIHPFFTTLRFTIACMAVWGSKVLFLPAIKMDGRRLRVIVHNVDQRTGCAASSLSAWRYADNTRIQLVFIFEKKSGLQTISFEVVNASSSSSSSCLGKLIDQINLFQSVFQPLDFSNHFFCVCVNVVQESGLD